MNKNIMYISRFLFAMLLVLTFYPGQISAICSKSCDGKCQVTEHQRNNIHAEVILKHGECCSNQSGKPSPCCNVKQDTPEDGRFFLLTTFRISLPDFFQIGIVTFEVQSVFHQTGYHPREHIVLNLPCSTPIYLRNLSFLC